VSQASQPGPAPKVSDNWLDPEPFLKELREYRWRRPEDQGELRLVAWSPTLVRGQTIEPAVDRHRGMTLVVAHLRLGPPPDPGGPAYDALAIGPEEAARP
jgi:hypothetical protein